MVFLNNLNGRKILHCFVVNAVERLTKMRLNHLIQSQMR